MQATTTRTERRTGFTLLELVMSLAVTAILMGGLTSAMLLATQALPDDRRPAEATVAATETANRIAFELAYALSFSERSAHAIAFTVADRDGDGDPESIRYEWSGTPGDALTYEYNGSAAVNLLASVRGFSLTYEVEAVTEQNAGPASVSAEQELMGYFSTSDLAEAHVHYNDRWWSQYFKPTLPADAITWTVTRVRFQAKQDNEAVLTRVGLRRPLPDHTPSDVIVDETILWPASLSSEYQWVILSFSKATDLSPHKGMCLTFTNDELRPARLRYQNKNVILGNAALSQGSPAWGTPDGSQALLFNIYGTVSTLGDPIQTTRNFLRRVDVSIELQANDAARVDAACTILNAPEVSP
ncbi:MAG: prepilin-type N-terminal cleavage/methylation domain-containing protein [Planctomycetes bacterium]|nr:prepilin-type N-terminal cleavage/methylation domain-containing protein [Planctomycetota bacterium]